MPEKSSSLERLLDQAALVGVVERLARDLLGGHDREVGDLPADVVERPLGGGLDVALGALGGFREDLLAALAGLVLVGLGRLARALDDLLGLSAGLLQPLAVFLEHLVGLLAQLRRRRRCRLRSSSRACPGLRRSAGTPHLRRMNSEIANTTIVQIMSPTLGVIRNEPLEEASGMCGAVSILAYRKKAMKPPTRP